MSGTREIAQRYMDLLCLGRFEDAFGLLSEDATYRIIGSTPLSAPMRGRKTILATLPPALGGFKQPLKLTFKELIVEGDRAVGLASGSGVGPLGQPYNQSHYAMVLRVRNEHITDVVEYMDTVEVETKLVGKKLVGGA